MPRGTGIYEDEPRDELPAKHHERGADAAGGKDVDAPDATVASDAQEGGD